MQNNKSCPEASLRFLVWTAVTKDYVQKDYNLCSLTNFLFKTSVYDSHTAIAQQIQLEPMKIIWALFHIPQSVTFSAPDTNIFYT